MGVLQSCRPRPEVLKGELTDAIFAADFGDVVGGEAPDVYQEAGAFFDNTYPTAELKRIASAVFGRLGNTKEGGGLLKLSTGYGGGKTHTLIALWHLAQAAADSTMGTEVLSLAERPKRVHVVGVDGSKGGVPVFTMHQTVRVNSLAGEAIYQLGGKKALDAIGDADDPEGSPNEEQIKAAFPEGPVLILLDELVIYMAKLSERGQGNLLGFLGSLASIVAKRPQTVLVVTDPADQRSYAHQARQLGKALEDDQLAAALKLDDVLGRKFSGFDPVGQESSRVIARRLFDEIDTTAAERTAADYLGLYKRVREDQGSLLPPDAVTPKYSEKIRESYPFHPRLMETARDRLGALEDFQKSRGVLRLFARILREVWERGDDLDLITAGDVNFSDSRVRADLLDRLNRDRFAAAISADVEQHARGLDGESEGRGVHERVASAILLESLPMEEGCGLTPEQLTLATLRLDEAGPEPVEAANRLEGVCWHLYPMEGGRGWRFRYQPNILKQIEERMSEVPAEDARSRVMAEVLGYFKGPAFKLAPWPSAPHDVADRAELQLVLCDSEDLAKRVVQYQDDRNPDSPMPRRFTNAIFAVAPNPAGLNDAVDRARRLLALESIKRETRGSTGQDAGALAKEQISRLEPELQKRFRIKARRAFDQVVLPEGRVARLPEQYAGDDEQVLSQPRGQSALEAYLTDKDLLYPPGANIDPQLLVNRILPATIHASEGKGVWTARALHERILSLPELRLVPNADVVRQTIRNAVGKGKLVVRTSDGTAYDKEGAVTGPFGDRPRDKNQRLPSTFSLDDDVMLAVAGSEAAKGWLGTTGVREPGPDDLASPPPPPPPEAVTVSDWGAVLAYPDRPLRRLKLSTNSLPTAKSLSSLVGPLGAESLSLTVFLEGRSRSGGEIQFEASNVALNDSARPLEAADRLFKALDKDSCRLEVVLTASFGTDGRTGLNPGLENLAHDRPADLTVEAEFGPAKGGDA